MDQCSAHATCLCSPQARLRIFQELQLKEIAPSSAPLPLARIITTVTTGDSVVAVSDHFPGEFSVGDLYDALASHDGIRGESTPEFQEWFESGEGGGNGHDHGERQKGAGDSMTYLSPLTLSQELGNHPGLTGGQSHAAPNRAMWPAKDLARGGGEDPANEHSEPPSLTHSEATLGNALLGGAHGSGRQVSQSGHPPGSRPLSAEGSVHSLVHAEATAKPAAFGEAGVAGVQQRSESDIHQAAAEEFGFTIEQKGKLGMHEVMRQSRTAGLPVNLKPGTPFSALSVDHLGGWEVPSSLGADMNSGILSQPDVAGKREGAAGGAGEDEASRPPTGYGPYILHAQAHLRLPTPSDNESQPGYGASSRDASTPAWPEGHPGVAGQQRDGGGDGLAAMDGPPAPPKLPPPIHFHSISLKSDDSIFFVISGAATVQVQHQNDDMPSLSTAVVLSGAPSSHPTSVSPQLPNRGSTTSSVPGSAHSGRGDATEGGTGSASGITSISQAPEPDPPQLLMTLPVGEVFSAATALAAAEKLQLSKGQFPEGGDPQGLLGGIGTLSQSALSQGPEPSNPQGPLPAPGTRHVSVAASGDEVVEVLYMSAPMYDLTAAGDGRVAGAIEIARVLAQLAWAQPLWKDTQPGAVNVRARDSEWGKGEAGREEAALAPEDVAWKLMGKCRVEEYKEVGAC